MSVGDTLIRTRVNWHLGFGLITDHSSSIKPPNFWWHDARIFGGIWGDKTVSSSTGPPSPNDTGESPGWLQWGIMQPIQVRHTITGAADQIQEIIYTFDAEVGDAKGRRGPWEAAGALWAAWEFDSTFDFWSDASGGQQGYIAGSLGFAALVLQAP